MATSRVYPASHIPALDGMRGAAVMLVITYHFGLLRFGWTGVSLFFVLSGFLITSILLDASHMGLGNFLGRFYWRRSLRILPLYFAFVLSVMAVWMLTGFPTGAGKQFPWLASFSYNFYMAFGHRAGLEQIFHHLWSISTEEQFYLLWPLAVWLLGRKGIGAIGLAMLVLAPLIRFVEPSIAQSYGLEDDMSGKLIYYLPFGHIDAFAVGGIIAAFVNGPWRRKPLLWGIALTIPGMVIVMRTIYLYATGVIAHWPIHLGFPMSSTAEGFHLWGYSAVYLCFGGCMIMALYGPPRLWIKRLAEWGPSGFIGKISYGMYVLHWPILLVLEELMPLSDNLLLRLVQFKGKPSLFRVVVFGEEGAVLQA
jgi:peptidoglycan/LPS O-acetylase OafA/YrhL